MADEGQQEQQKGPTPLEVLRAKMARLHVVLNTPEGREIVESLRQQFLTRLQGKDEIEMSYKAGCANVVAWLLEAQQNNYEGR